jgi:hypothetical protein
MIKALNEKVKPGPDESVFDILGRRRICPVYSGIPTPTLKINGHVKEAPLLALVTVSTAEKLSVMLGQAIIVNDGHNVTLLTDNAQ